MPTKAERFEEAKVAILAGIAERLSPEALQKVTIEIAKGRDCLTKVTVRRILKSGDHRGKGSEEQPQLF